MDVDLVVILTIPLVGLATLFVVAERREASRQAERRRHAHEAPESPAPGQPG